MKTKTKIRPLNDLEKSILLVLGSVIAFSYIYFFATLFDSEEDPQVSEEEIIEDYSLTEEDEQRIKECLLGDPIIRFWYKLGFYSFLDK